MNYLLYAILLFFYSGQIAFSAPNAMEVLRGLGKTTKSTEYNPINSPFVKNYLKNTYYYGNYSNINKEKTNTTLKCIVKDRPEGKPDYCPQDPFAALLQWMFPNFNLDGNFAPNRRLEHFKDIVSKFTPVTIGLILNEILKFETHQTSQKLMDGIVSVIMGNLFKDRVGLDGRLAALKTEYESKYTPLATPEFPTLGSIKSSGATIRDKMNELDSNSQLTKDEKKEKRSEILEKYKPSFEQVSFAKSYYAAIEKTKVEDKKTEERIKKWKSQATLFAQIIHASLTFVDPKTRTDPKVNKMKKDEEEEETDSTAPKHSEASTGYSLIYHPKSVQLTLLLFAWEISQTKDDIVQFLMSMPDGINTEHVKKYASTSSSFTADDFKSAQDQLFKSQDPSLLKDQSGLELAALISVGKKIFTKTYPDKFGYDVAPLMKEPFSTDKNKQTIYELTDKISDNITVKRDAPDCGSTSLRNVLNFLLYNSSKSIFDIDLLLKKATVAGYTLNQKLVDFYRQYKGLTSVPSASARADWFRVTSFLKGNVQYTKMAKIGGKFTSGPVCEISPDRGISNMMKVIGVLLGIPPPPQEKNDKIDMSNLEKLLKLASAMGNGEWTWKSDKGNDYLLKSEDIRTDEEIDQLRQADPDFKVEEINIGFYLDGKKIFSWAFMPGHFGFESHIFEKKDAIKISDVNILKTFSTDKPFPTFIPEFLSSNLTPKVLNPDNYNGTARRNTNSNINYILFSQNIDNFDSRMILIKTAIQYNQPFLSSIIYRLIEEIKDLALNDENAMNKLIESIITNSDLTLYVIQNFGIKSNASGMEKVVREALKIGNGNLVRSLVPKYIKIDDRLGDQGNKSPTLVLLAVQAQNLSLLKHLIDLGANLTLIGFRTLHSPLTLAISKKNLEMVKLLLEKGADPNILTGRRLDSTALIDAAQRNFIEAVELLLNNRANLELKLRNGTPVGEKAYSTARNPKIKEMILKKIKGKSDS